MVFAAIHPGFNTEYVTYGSTAEEAETKLRELLENNHGGLAAGMLASSRIEEITTPITGEDLGRCWNDTPSNLNQQGVNWIWADDDTADWPTEIEGYYTDEAGSPVIFVIDWNYDEE